MAIIMGTCPDTYVVTVSRDFSLLGLENCNRKVKRACKSEYFAQNILKVYIEKSGTSGINFTLS